MENNIDKLFKSKLDGHSTDYKPSAWGNMAALLDEDKSDYGKAPIKTKRSWLRLFGLALFLIISVGGFSWFLLSQEKSVELESNLASENHEIGNNKTSSIVSAQSVHEVKESSSLKFSDNHKNRNENKVSSVKLNETIGSIDQQSSNFGKTSISNTLNKSTVHSYSAALDFDTQMISNNNTNDESLLNQIFVTNNKKSLQAERTLVASTIVEETNHTSDFKKSLDKTEQKNNFEPRTIFEFERLTKSTERDATLMDKLVQPITQLNKKAKASYGLLTSLGYANGGWIQSGPSVTYRLNNTWALNSALQFEYAQIDNLASFTIENKVYSFGSILTESTVNIIKRTALNLPLSLSRDFGRFELSAGLAVNYLIAAQGKISDNEGKVSTSWLTSERFKPLTINYNLAASYQINRNVNAIVGVEYKSALLKGAETSINNTATILPKIGFKINLTKI